MNKPDTETKVELVVNGNVVATYDGELTDVLKFQSEVFQAICQSALAKEESRMARTEIYPGKYLSLGQKSD